MRHQALLVGIVGMGTIGRAIAQALDTAVMAASLRAVNSRNIDKARQFVTSLRHQPDVMSSTSSSPVAIWSLKRQRKTPGPSCASHADGWQRSHGVECRRGTGSSRMVRHGGAARVPNIHSLLVPLLALMG